MAQTAEPSSAYNVFIKIKVLLMKSNAPAASEELPKLLAAEDFTLDLLRASGCHPACLPNWFHLSCHRVYGVRSQCVQDPTACCCSVILNVKCDTSSFTWWCTLCTVTAAPVDSLRLLASCLNG